MSYFRDNIDKLAGYVPGFQPHGVDVVKLNTNENPYPPSLLAVESIRNISVDNLRRYPQPLGDDFRKAAAKVVGVTPENIMCTNGGDDLLTICFRAFCDENRGVAYPVSTYSLYPVLAKMQNCKATEIPFGADYSLPADALAGCDAGLVIVCNPNAPSGSFTRPDEMEKLAKSLSGKSVLLIDEAYVDFAEENCAGLVSRCDNVIILRSMSKGYSLAGLRFGYAIAPVEMIEGLCKVKDSYNVDAIAIAAATAAIRDQDYFRLNVAKVKAERRELTDGLRDIGFDVPESSSNFVLAQCKNCDAENIYKSLVDRKIYVRYFKLDGLEDKLRITVGTQKDNHQLLCSLKEILSNIRGC